MKLENGEIIYVPEYSTYSSVNRYLAVENAFFISSSPVIPISRPRCGAQIYDLPLSDITKMP